jgi:hypothetical protein
MASDFDQTLSFNDSGRVLSEIMGISGFDEKVAGLAKTNLVQQGYIDRVSAGYGKIAVLQELETRWFRITRSTLVTAVRTYLLCCI